MTILFHFIKCYFSFQERKIGTKKKLSSKLDLEFLKEADSAQYHTASSREIEMSENPKLSNTVRSPTPLPSQTIFILFSKTYISMTFTEESI